MKKLFMFLVLGIVLFTVGCTTNFSTTSRATYTIPPITTAGQTTNGGTTSWGTSTAPHNTTIPTTKQINSLDLSRIYAEVYARIYEELYEAVRAEVIADISQERFDAIYNQVIQEVIQKISDGDIVVSPQSVIERVMEVARSNASSVIGVSTYSATGQLLGTGSGVFFKHIGDKYYIVTNAHVVENGSTFEVVFEDGSTIQAILRGVDQLVDIAVLYFTSTNTYTIATFADSNLVQKGDIILAVGNPSGYTYYNSMTMGIVSGVNRYFDTDNDGSRDMFVNYMQHDAAINAGNSGGALFNLAGQVVGINVIKISSVEIEGMGFAIPSNLAKIISDEIIEFGVSSRMVFLGISFLDLSALSTEAKATLTPPVPSGVTNGFYVIGVDSRGSLFGKIQAGDILVSFGSIEIVDSVQFVRARFETYRVGDIVSVTYLRNGQLVTVNDIVLKSRN
jgi:serine protease Do